MFLNKLVNKLLLGFLVVEDRLVFKIPGLLFGPLTLIAALIILSAATLLLDTTLGLLALIGSALLSTSSVFILLARFYLLIKGWKKNEDVQNYIKPILIFFAFPITLPNFLWEVGLLIIVALAGLTIVAVRKIFKSHQTITSHGQNTHNNYSYNDYGGYGSYGHDSQSDDSGGNDSRYSNYEDNRSDNSYDDDRGSQAPSAGDMWGWAEDSARKHGLSYDEQWSLYRHTSDRDSADDVDDRAKRTNW